MSDANSTATANAATTTTAILCDNRDGVHTITMNRPDVRNAMSLAMVNELMDALRQAEAGANARDNPTRIIVLRGAGGHFCAGGDIKDMMAARMRMAESGEDEMAAVNARFGQLCLAYARTPLAVIAVLEGSVMGGGFGLACVADVALADASTSFRLPETALGIVPAQIAPFLVERLGYSEAKRLIVTGGAIGAEEALALRLIHSLHPDTAALDLALSATINKIKQCAPGALAAAKQLVQSANTGAPESLIDAAAKIFSQALQSAEGIEGSSAFMQKRKPHWANA
jgi:isohexenylglutaconyl-CoA hydratase